MGQDIREMFRKEDQLENIRLPKGHQKRFETRLDKAFSESKGRWFQKFWKIAAVLVIALGVGGFFFLNKENLPASESNGIIVDNAAEVPEQKNNTYRLSEVSPEFKKIEDYYLASLNMQLARLELTSENKELVDAFMQKLSQLDEEYQALNAEIEETGITGETVEALIANLQLRLDLLNKLKNKLNEIHQSKNDHHENYQA